MGRYILPPHSLKIKSSKPTNTLAYEKNQVIKGHKTKQKKINHRWDSSSKTQLIPQPSVSILVRFHLFKQLPRSPQLSISYCWAVLRYTFYWSESKVLHKSSSFIMLTIGNKNRGQFVHIFANAIQQKLRIYRKVNKTASTWRISQAALIYRTTRHL